LIQAVAGSGKTSTLLQLLSMCDSRTLFLAFNKGIQEEIQARITEKGLAQGKALTLHSMGLSAIRNNTKFRIDNRKNLSIVKLLQEKNRTIFNNLTWEKKLRMSFTLSDFNDVSRIYMTDDIVQIMDYMANMDKGFFETDWLEDMWEQFIEVREEFMAENNKVIDFIDMIYLPLKLDYEIPVYCTYLMIDEAQDLNYAQHLLIDKLISQGTIRRFIAVGDTRQSIYGFSGSYASSFQRFKDKENTVELPLDICYRCPTAVVDSANEIYNVMSAHKTYRGTVKTITDGLSVKESSMVICRNSTPLLNLYFELLGAGRKVFLKGEDILPLIKNFLKPYAYKSVSYAKAKMEEEFITLEENKFSSDKDRMKYYWFKQQYENTLLLVNKLCSPGSSVQDLLTKLDTVFSSTPDEDAVTLCTIHKSKGLEANVVYILNEYLIPSKFASSDSQLQQEKNLKYVARTRAKEELYFLNIT
jgi:superfamily I DNA/RNA helicase